MQEHNNNFSYYISGAAFFVAIAAFTFACWSVQTETLNDGQRNEIAIVLTTVEIVIVIAAIFGFWTIRESVARQTRDIAKAEAGEIVTKFLEQNGSDLIKEAFKDTELVSRLEAAFQDSMIDSSADADYVDDDPDWKP
ncbi:hypothetical protein J4729_22220 [Leisingera sp. HS039]|uniref:hypothetical protein n=1 Tax=unclassified Leisingera TaxID=2614906 RepID=UPI001070D23F|nr:MULTISPECIES: hypothetical protein [unclassified Leisingera]MBQ4827236.1 hypothetical protein [Leisingera sp. HS039]QBR36980.1 hypothetical protein ETW23_13385 [Leisingera sp. NJS201]